MTRTRTGSRKRKPGTADTTTPKRTDASNPGPTLVDIRPNPFTDRRRRNFVGPLGPNETAAVRAAQASAAARLPIPVRLWNGSTAQLADGALVIHNPGDDREFTAHIACRHGAIHGWPIRTAHDLGEARAVTHACERPHGSVNADQALTQGVNTSPPKTLPVLVVHEGLRRTADTQPLTLAAITDSLADRAADTETAKEHPET